LLSRARLTGDWGGVRDELGKKGIALDADLLLIPQGVASGGKDIGTELWGNTEYTLNVDTGKAGLWPGGFLRVMGQSSFGDNVLSKSGAFAPVNTAALLPSPRETTSALLNATFVQFLSPKFGIIVGKVFTFDSAQGEFAGNYRTQFLDTALIAPMAADLVPISAYGGGLIVLPWEGLTLSALALDPSGTPTNNDVTEAFNDGFMLLASGKLAIKPFGLAGHQSVGFMWSDKDHLQLNQDPSNILRILLRERFPRLGDPGPGLRRLLERFFPNLLLPVEPLKRQSETWLVTYGFEQYLWQPGSDPHRGIGVFFNFGASDGVVNPVRYSYNMGIGGNGVVPGRLHDSFGLSWARTEISGNFLPFLRTRLDLGLDREDAIEMFYNAALTPWLGVTLDLQVIEPAIKKKIESNQLKSVDTTLIVGGRFYIRF